MIGDREKQKLAAFYTSDMFEVLGKLIAHKIQVLKSDKQSGDSFEQTALKVAKTEGGEEFGKSLLDDIKNYYKKLVNK